MCSERDLRRAELVLAMFVGDVAGPGIVYADLEELLWRILGGGCGDDLLVVAVDDETIYCARNDDEWGWDLVEVARADIPEGP